MKKAFDRVTLDRSTSRRYLCAIVLVQVSSILISCEKVLDVDTPRNQIVRSDVFSENLTAISAVRGVYFELASNNWASGNLLSVTNLIGLYSDELELFSSDTDREEFFQGAIRPRNPLVKTLWDGMYKTIYAANAIMEGVMNSDGIASSIKDQLEGEARFVRAFSNFYLVNLFGRVPLVTSTDYRVNNTMSRSSVDEIYALIISDLEQAKVLLSDDYFYSSNQRIVPNRVAATAFLARVYLFVGDWEAAEEQATIVLNSKNYTLEYDLDDVFLASSTEAIWQLQPLHYANEASSFINVGPPFNQALSDDFIESIEEDDRRFASWVGSSTDGAAVWYHPFKYKVRSGPVGDELSMVFRLAEQYLIRAEARVHQNEFDDAIADIDVIRQRAGLSLIQDTEPSIGKADLLLAIEQERRVELFSEWGHRWFDLKRLGRLDAVLSEAKPDWQYTDALLPIPQDDIEINRNLLPQNDGY